MNQDGTVNAAAVNPDAVSRALPELSELDRKKVMILLEALKDELRMAPA